MRRLFGSERKLRNALTVLLALTMLVAAFAVASSVGAGASLAHSPATKSAPAKPAVTYTYGSITFSEVNLPTGQAWGVLLTSAGYALGNNSPSNIVWTVNSTNAAPQYGNYTFSIVPIPGWDVVSIVGTPANTSGVPGCGPAPDTMANYCNVTGASATVVVTFHASPIYTVQFNESGLTTGTAWSVTFDGSTVIGTGTTISFGSSNGTFAYSVGLGGTDTGANGSTPSSGMITVAGLTYLNITFFPTVTVSVSYPVGEFSTNGLPYFSFPLTGNRTYNVTWNVAVTGAVLNAADTSQTLEFIWLQPVPSPGCGPFTYPCPVIYSVSIPFTAEKSGGTAGSGTFTFGVDAANLTSSTYLGFQLPQGQWQIEVVTDVANPVTGGAGEGSTVQAAFIGPVPPNGAITAPTSGTTVSEGVVTIAGSFSGYFVVSANVTVLNGSGFTVFTASVYAPSFTTNPFSVPWHASVPGQYTIVLTLVAAWHLATTVSETVTVTAANSITYFNQSGLNIGGLGGGGSAALLVLIGTVVGMVVMALVGRGLWGGSKPSPAQPWSGQGSKPMDDTMGGSGGMSGGGMSGGGTGGNPPS